MLRVLSLGAGVQSSTLALMAAHGEAPMPDCAIFADTQAEPIAVYEWLAFLEPRLPFPVRRVTAGSLRDEVMAAAAGRRRMDGRPPFFVSGGVAKTSDGMLHRQCTRAYKIRPIEREVRAVLGLRRGQRWPKSPAVEQIIGISLDEVQRCKEARDDHGRPRPAIVNRWPLIERSMTREDCVAWLAAHGYPRPPKSACTFCPYHDAEMWRDMKANDPRSFADAVMVDRAIRNGSPENDRQARVAISPAKWFVHNSCTPLEKAVTLPPVRRLEAADDERSFGVECEGMCGL